MITDTKPAAGRRGAGLTPMETRRDVIVRAALLADELGYEFFAVPEGWGLDPTPLLAEIALRTSRIRLASAVLSVWGRTPATLAMTAATLQQVSGGRYILGLGASTRALAEGFHDVPFEHPAARLRDVAATVRALLDGQPAPLSRVPDARPLRLAQPPAPELPLWIAALGPHTLRVAAELGDGWIPALAARDRLPGWTAELRRLREAAGRADRPLTVAAGPMAVVAEDGRTAYGIAASTIAWYLSAMGDVYARSVAGQGYAAEVEAIVAANPKPSPQRGIVPPQAHGLLDQLAAYGTGDQVREQLERWEGHADIVSIMLPPGLPWPVIEATLRAAAPRLALAAGPSSPLALATGPAGVLGSVMARTFRTVGLDFIDSAPNRTVVRVLFDHPPAAVFGALADAPGWGRWFPGFSVKSHYLTPAPYGAGSRREMVVFGRPVTETILAWDEASRFAFAVEAATMPGISALAEDYRLADEPGGSSLTWTMAYDASVAAAGLLIGATATASFRKAGRKLNQLLAGS